jgi:uncharacterized protein (DUF1330 family)
MSVYVVAQLRFKDIERYRRYQSRFADVFKQFPGGRLMVADEAPRQLEGDWRADKIVIMAFDSEDQARRFLDSPQYAEISVDRQAGADVNALLVRGLG